MNSILLFATEWQDVFVPVAIGLLSPLVTGIFGFLYIRQTKWYRRLSRWEPYGRELWLLQTKTYFEMCQAARIAMIAAYDKTWNCCDGESEHNMPLIQVYREKRAIMDTLAVQSSIILSKRFNEVYAEFAHTMFVFATSSKNDKGTHDTCDKIQALYGELLEAARESLNTDVLEGLKTDVMDKELMKKLSGFTVESSCGKIPGDKSNY
ncbi:MAG TPA: hypothetical protein VIH42_09595 [Thermoguttaceae bacterium]